MWKPILAVVAALAVVAVVWTQHANAAFTYQWSTYSDDAKAAACQHWRDAPGDAWATWNLSGPAWLGGLTSTEYAAHIRSVC